MPPPFNGLSWPALAAAALAFLATSAEVLAREVAIRGRAMQGFGRIELTFDVPTKVTLRNTGSVLVVGFGAPSRIRSEKLPEEIGAYVANSRRDPDEMGLRVALPRPYRANLLEAGERVFVDLLPETWTGLPPGLPPEVVAELARRARVAEERLRAEEARRARARGGIALRLAELPTRTRLIFEPPAGTPVRVTETDGRLEARFEGNLALDLGGSRPRAAPGVADFDVAEGAEGVGVRVAPAFGRSIRHFREDGTLVVDLVAPEPPPEPAAAASPGRGGTPAAPPAQPVAEKAVAAAPQAVEPPGARPVPASPAPAGVHEPAGIPLGSEIPSAPSGVVEARIVEKDGQAGLTIPFNRSTAAAAFERGGRLTVLFQSSDRIVVAASEEARSRFGFESVRRDGPFAIMTFASRPERPIRLLPDGNGWTIAGGGASLPSDELLVTRAASADGQGEVSVALAGATAVRWLLSTDEAPLAVVPTTGRQGMAAARGFVEFSLLPTIQGVVVQPVADDVNVMLGRGGVLVSRRSGLTLSPVGKGGVVGRQAPLVIAADAWHEASAGDALARIREQTSTAAEAPRSGKSKARFDLAATLLANGLNHEAAGLLALAAHDDPIFARSREALLLSGIAAIRAGRSKEARSYLSDDALSGDPEVALWRALLDAQERRWPQAVAGIRRGEPVLARYPDDLVGLFRLTMARAALAAGDTAAAQDAVSAIELLPGGVVERDQGAFVRGQLDEAAGRGNQALAIYDRLLESTSRPIAAEAALRSVILARKTARLPAEEAIRRLEALSLSWRGDEIELGAVVQLATLYGEAGRWREMFTLAGKADARFPDHDLTRALHDAAARRFEALFLGRGGAKLDPVEHLALYYDFKEFSPVGRRGDEIVRRIADRLVELDLLDQAASLLQYQVDRRLAGLPRSYVATRLAAIRLMSGKPALAIATLAGSRMAELPVPLRRLRLMIEAQAQADLTRVDLALEAIEDEDGVDFARLRASILFGSRRWREAGAAFEGLVGTRWQDKEPLTDEERQDIVRAVLADVMAEEWIALDRIKSKFAAKMADSPDAKLFEALTRPRSLRTPEFRAALRDAGRRDSVRRFLGDWALVSEPPGAPFGESGKEARGGSDRRPG